jgi:hypothetical protein
MFGFGGLVLTLLSLGHIGTQIAKEKLEPERKYIPPQQPEKKEPRWAEPRYNEYGKLIIDDFYQYKHGRTYNFMQAQAWAKEGKYNLPKDFVTNGWDSRAEYDDGKIHWLGNKIVPAEPMCDEEGNFVNTNYYQYCQDVKQYGKEQAEKWASEGRYNMPKGQYTNAWDSTPRYAKRFAPNEIK